MLCVITNHWILGALRLNFQSSPLQTDWAVCERTSSRDMRPICELSKGRECKWQTWINRLTVKKATLGRYQMRIKQTCDGFSNIQTRSAVLLWPLWSDWRFAASNCLCSCCQELLFLGSQKMPGITENDTGIFDAAWITMHHSHMPNMANKSEQLALEHDAIARGLLKVRLGWNDQIH